MKGGPETGKWTHTALHYPLPGNAKAPARRLQISLEDAPVGAFPVRDRLRDVSP